MKKSTEKTLLWVAGGAAALFILPDLLGSKNADGTSTNPITSIFGGGGGSDGSTGLGGLLDGLGNGISGLFGNLGLGLGNLTGNLTGNGTGLFSGLDNTFKGLTDSINKVLTNNGNNPLNPANPNAPVSPTDTGSKYPPSYPNTIPNILYSGGDLVKSLGVTAIEGVGAYLGYKALSPVIAGISKSAAPIVSRAITGGGNVALNAGRSVISGVTKGLGTYSTLLRTPLSALPSTGVLGMTGAAVSVVAAGAAGYGLGTLFNKTAPGKALIEKSGELGAAFERTNIGQNVMQVFGVAKPAQVVTTSPNPSGGLAYYGYTIADVKSFQQKGITGAAFVNYMKAHPRTNVKAS